MPSKIIENRVVEVKVGTIVENAAGRHAALLPSDWDACQFRFPNPVPGWETKHAIALNVKITGRTFQYRNGGNYYVKAELEFVGDGEPSTFTEGWIKVSPWDCLRAE